MFAKIWLRGAMLAASSLALAACGDGGGGIASTGTPPTPPATYAKIADMTGNRTFQTGGVTYNADPLRLMDGTTQQFGSGVTVAYNASADSYTVTAPAGPAVIFFLSGTSPTTTSFSGMTQTFGPADLQPANPSLPNGVTYVKVDGTARHQLTLIAPGGSVPLSYTTLGTWSTVEIGSNSGTFRIAVGGSPTLASDMPKNGSASYAIGVGGTAIKTETGLPVTTSTPLSLPSSGMSGSSTLVTDVTPYPPGYPVTTTYNLSGNSSGTFSANFATGAITTTLALVGTVAGPGATPVNFGTFNGTGTLTSGGPGYTGTLAGGQTPSTGIFSGAFFGPQALETAFGYFLSGTNFSAAGAVVGAKQ